MPSELRPFTEKLEGNGGRRRRYLDIDLDRGGKIKGVNGALKDASGKIVDETYPPGTGRDECIIWGFVDVSAHAIGGLPYRLKRAGAKRVSGFAAILSNGGILRGCAHGLPEIHRALDV